MNDDEGQLLEEGLELKKTCKGRRSSKEEGLQRKKTFHGRRTSMKENFQWKKIFDRKRPSMKEVLVIGPSMDKDLRWKKS